MQVWIHTFSVSLLSWLVQLKSESNQAITVVPQHSNCFMLVYFGPQSIFVREFCFSTQLLNQHSTITLKHARDVNLTCDTLSRNKKLTTTNSRAKNGEKHIKKTVR